MLCKFHSKDPEEISEAELEAYFLHRRNADHCSASTLRICCCGIRSCFVRDGRSDQGRVQSRCPLDRRGLLWREAVEPARVRVV